MAGWTDNNTVTVGDATEVDASLVFDGNAQDYYIAMDDSEDELVCGLGSVVGTTPAWEIDINQVVTFPVGLKNTTRSVTANTTSQAASLITAGAINVDCIGVTGAATDFIVLPALANVPNGHTITILCNASSAFELRTPASSSEEINSENCDGTKEYACTDTEVVKVIKVNATIGWMAHAFSQIGAVVAAVVPD